MTEEEKEELLKQIQQDLPDDDTKEGGDSFDLFIQSFGEISKTWSESLKEFDTLYPDYPKKDEDSNP